MTDKKHLLKLDISDRKWFIDDGCWVFPPGEAYIAPIESNNNGDLLVPVIT